MMRLTESDRQAIRDERLRAHGRTVDHLEKKANVWSNPDDRTLDLLLEAIEALLDIHRRMS